MREVKLVIGHRKKDLTEFWGLKFTNDRSHAGVFLTPCQFRTILALAEEGKRLLRKLPGISPQQSKEN